MKARLPIFRLLVSMIMLMPLLAACGGAQPATTQPTAGAAQPATSATQPAGDVATAASTAAASAAASGEDWKQDTTPITINWFVSEDWYNKKWDPQNNLFDKMVTEETGVTVNFTSGNLDKLSAMIASGDLPDVITSWYINPQVQLLQTSGQVLPLDELAKQNAPNFKIPESMLKWHGEADGHLYGFMSYFYAVENMKAGEALPTHVSMRARQDLMDQLGIKPEAFETKEGTLDALRKVRDAKLKYNGFDVAPYYPDGSVTQLQQFFGARREDEQGNYVNRDYEPETLEALKFLNQLYRENLVPQDAFTLNRQQVIEKVGQGAVFAYTGSLLDPGGSTLYANDPKAFYVKAGPIKGDAGKPFQFDPSPLAGWTATMINKDTKNPERIIRFFEYMYQRENIHLMAQFGPKGAAWDFDANGKVKYTDSYLAEKKADSAKAALKYDASMGWFIDWVPVMRAWPAPANPQEQAQQEADTFFAKQSYPDLAFSELNPEAGTDEGNIRSQIDDYHTQQIAKIVTTAKSEAEVEPMFKDMIAQEKQLGYDRLYAWQNERFKASKQKLGIKFAWPANE